MIKQRLREKIYRRYNISFSKSGEDVQLAKLIGRREPGWFVDVGCWHPVKASNSYYFSLRGWKGISIDPNPELMDLYKKYRPNDLFLNLGVGNSDHNLEYFFLQEEFSSMNTINKNFILEHDLESKIKSILEIEIVPLSQILDRHLPKGIQPDFFDVDVEGYDLEVLKSNNWERYRPKNSSM